MNENNGTNGHDLEEIIKQEADSNGLINAPEEDNSNVSNRGLTARIYNYLTDKGRLKALCVLGCTIAGVALLKDQLPKVTEFTQEHIQFLSNEMVSLTVDTVTNTLMAPVGFLLSNYAHGTKLNKKEFLGQVAFAGGWGVIRHYVYSGLSNFDEITPLNVSLKTSLYTAYYAAYGGLYAAFSEYWSKVCNDVPHMESIKGVGKNFSRRLESLVKDPGIQFNLVLNIVNMFNPWVESRPTVAGGLLIDYNMNVVRHSHERKHGFWGYFRSVFVSERLEKGIESIPLALETQVVGETYAQATFGQRIMGLGGELLGDLVIMNGAILPTIPLACAGYSIWNGDIGLGLLFTGLSGVTYFPAKYCIRLGRYLRMLGNARLHGLSDKEYEKLKYSGLKIFHPNDPRTRVIDSYIQRELS